MKKNIAILALLCLILGGFFVSKLLLPDADFSETERRKLKPMPELSADTLKNGSFMQEFESYALDRFPLRDTFRGLKSAVQLGVFLQADNNELYLVNGSIAKQEYPLNSESLSYAATVFNSLYQTYLADTDTRVYFSVVPDKSAFLAPVSGNLQLDYPAFYAAVQNALPPEMTFADIADLLCADDYYRTDPHWKQEALVPVAERLLSAMGAEISADFSAQTLDSPFNGVYAGQLALPMRADSITVLQHPDFDGCTVFDWEHNREIPVYDLSRAEGLDPYETYLSGALPLITVENPGCTNGRELVIFRDSYGSALAPLLIPSYSKITLVDIRYLSSRLLGNYLEFTDQDVLFLYSTSVLNHSETLK